MGIYSLLFVNRSKLNFSYITLGISEMPVTSFSVLSFSCILLRPMLMWKYWSSCLKMMQTLMWRIRMDGSQSMLLHAGEMLDAWLFIVSSHLPQMRVYHVVVASL